MKTRDSQKVHGNESFMEKFTKEYMDISLLYLLF